MLAGARMALMCAIGAVDARERRLPNALAAAFAALCALEALAARGAETCAQNALAALVVCGALLGFELLWRAVHGGAAGMGMGDVKYLFALMLLDPAFGLVSFTGGLALLAFSGAVVRAKSLPLLPFAVMSYMGMVAAAALLMA